MRNERKKIYAMKKLWNMAGTNFSKPKFLSLLPSYFYVQYFVWIFFIIKENELLLQNFYMSFKSYLWIEIKYWRKYFLVFFVTICILQQDIFDIIFYILMSLCTCLHCNKLSQDGPLWWVVKWHGCNCQIFCSYSCKFGLYNVFFFYFSFKCSTWYFNRSPCVAHTSLVCCTISVPTDTLLVITTKII